MNTPVMAWLDRGVHEAKLRSVDRAFARFLASLDEGGDERVLMAAALASRELGEGHICVDIEALAAAEPMLANAQAWLPGSPLVGSSKDDPGTPLVLDGGLLYLRRFWRDEARVAEAILSRLAPSVVPADLAQELDRLFPASRPG